MITSIQKIYILYSHLIPMGYKFVPIRLFSVYLDQEFRWHLLHFALTQPEAIFGATPDGPSTGAKFAPKDGKNLHRSLLPAIPASPLSLTKDIPFISRILIDMHILKLPRHTFLNIYKVMVQSRLLPLLESFR